MRTSCLRSTEEGPITYKISDWVVLPYSQRSRYPSLASDQLLSTAYQNAYILSQQHCGALQESAHELVRVPRHGIGPLDACRERSKIKMERSKIVRRLETWYFAQDLFPLISSQDSGSL